MRRRRFLQGSGVVVATIVAGCSGSEEDQESSPTETSTSTESPTDTESGTPEDETPTEEDEDPEVDRPENYRWDMSSWVNTELRNELGQYVEGDVSRVLPSHPAFEYSTEQPEDDQPVDFVGLKLYREAQFDVMSENPNTGPIEQVVNAFVDESLYESAKNGDFIRNDTEAPSSFNTDEWLNAETVEESLDLGHNLIVSIAYNEDNLPIEQQASVIREAYKRHHDFDVLAWGVPMQDESLTSGMMYSPDDDTVRTFNVGGSWSGSGEAQIHTEIQGWRVFNNPENVQSGGDPTDLHHPLLFHTDDWNRGAVSSFEDAKDQAIETIFSIATDTYNDYNIDAVELNDAPIDNITMTTGATEQLTRTLLDYNKSSVDAEFDDVWQLSSFAIGKYLQDPLLNGVIDTVESGGEDYDEYFGGGFAFYEVDNEDIIDEVRTDQAGEYDNFGQVYDELEAA